MKAKIAKVLWMTAVILIFAAGFAAAQTANTIVYQGRLTNDAGEPVATATDVLFGIYAGLTGGMALYDTTASVTPDNNGVFTIELGPLTTTIMNGSKRYLGIKVGADAEMTPRQILTSAPSAHTALNVPNSSISAADLATNSVGASEIATNAVGSAEILNGSVTDVDILDEPGIAHAYTFGGVPLTNTIVSSDSVSITIPTSGYIVIQASGFFKFNHPGGGSRYIRASISTSRTTIDYDNFAIFTSIESTNGLYHVPFSIIGVKNVTQGTYTYYLTASTTGGTNSSLDRTHLLATFYPTSYGSVDVTKANRVIDPADPSGAEIESKPGMDNESE